MASMLFSSVFEMGIPIFVWPIQGSYRRIRVEQNSSALSIPLPCTCTYFNVKRLPISTNMFLVSSPYSLDFLVALRKTTKETVWSNNAGMLATQVD
jgi:hypothetical protein